MAESPIDNTPVALSPLTFDRMDQAAQYVEDQIRTRAPRASIQRSPGAASGAWGMLAMGDSITGRSGLTLGGGTVELCDQEDELLTPTGDIVTVYNSGRVINAPTDVVIVPLSWNKGYWRVISLGSSCQQVDAYY